MILKKDFDKVQQSFSQVIIEREQIIENLLPFLAQNITSSEIKIQLLNLFQTQLRMKGSVLSKEGEFGENIYILVKGFLKIEKRYQNKKNIYYQQYENVKISLIDTPQFIGEEIIIDYATLDKSYAGYVGQERKYQYTVTVDTGEAQLYQISRLDLKTRFPHEVMDYLTEQFFVKEKRRLSALEQLVEQVASKKDPIYDIDPKAHQFNYLKN